MSRIEDAKPSGGPASLVVHQLRIFCRRGGPVRKTRSGSVSPLAYGLDAERRGRVDSGLREHCRLQEGWQLCGLAVRFDEIEVSLISALKPADLVASLKAAADHALRVSGLESKSTLRWEDGFELVDADRLSPTAKARIVGQRHG